MRGKPKEQRTLLMVGSLDERIPAQHPIRRIKELADQALAALEPTFERMYAAVGRPSVPPERLLKAQLLIALFSVRSDRQLCEQLAYNLLFRWFLDLELDEEAFDASTFSRNRERLLRHEVADQFLGAVVAQAKGARLLSAEHFSLDGTMIEAWASMKSFRPKDEDDDSRGDGNGWGDFRGTPRSNETHASQTDPEAKLLRKGKGREAKLCFLGHALMENRNGLVVDLRVSEANGTAEREHGLRMLADLSGAGRVTVGADRGDDTRDFVETCRGLEITPHVAQNTSRRRSAVDRRTTRHPGYSCSQVARRRIEKIFGWLKDYGGLRRSRFRGVARTEMAAQLAAAAYNLLRIARLELAGVT